MSSVNESGIALARLTRPLVGLKPVTPQKCAGRRIEPPVSEPSAAGTSRARDRRAGAGRRAAGDARGFHGLRDVAGVDVVPGRPEGELHHVERAEPERAGGFEPLDRGCGRRRDPALADLRAAFGELALE